MFSNFVSKICLQQSRSLPWKPFTRKVCQSFTTTTVISSLNDDIVVFFLQTNLVTYSTFQNYCRVQKSQRSLTKLFTSEWTPTSQSTSSRFLATDHPQNKKKEDLLKDAKEPHTLGDSKSSPSSPQLESQQPQASKTSTQLITQKKDKEFDAQYRLPPYEKMRSLVESRKSGTLTTANLFPVSKDLIIFFVDMIIFAF
jgi:hypothetical protein